MAYSEQVLDHYENPRNVGIIEEDNSVGTGMVGAPACGDVMRLQIKVDDTGIIENAKFKTYGCFVSNTTINTPTKGKKISELSVGDKVLAWNGENIVSNEIEKIISRSVPVDDLLVVTFQRESHRKNMKPNTFKLIVTSEHVFWNANNKPILAKRVGKYKVDFVNEDTKHIVEIYGDYWHCHPELFEADRIHPTMNKPAHEKWKKDDERKKYLEEQGYTVEIIWERDAIKKIKNNT